MERLWTIIRGRGLWFRFPLPKDLISIIRKKRMTMTIGGGGGGGGGRRGGGGGGVVNNHHRVLPEDLLLAILRRLPAKSLVRLKVVSKYFLNLISDPKFLSNSPKIIVHTSDILVRATKVNRYVYFSIPCPSSNGEQNPVRETTIHDHTKDRGHNSEVTLLAACNGLLLLRSESLPDPRSTDKPFHQLYVSNPFTQQSLYLRCPPRGYSHFWSLVCDSSTQTYKILAAPMNDERCYLLTLPPPPVSSEPYYWRRLVRPHPEHLICATHMASFGNHLYWISYSRQSKISYVEGITVDTEEFTNINLPSDACRGCHKLFQMKGSLYMAHTISDDLVGMWILEDKVNSLWSKAYTIDLSSIENRPEDLTTRHDMKFFPVENTNEIFIRFLKWLISFDITSHKWKVHFDDPQFLIFSSFPHVNSLVNW